MCIWGVLLYFGPVWLVLGIAPIIVANYESPRHVYLASLGWAMVLGIVMQVLWQARPHRLLRPVAVIAAAALLTLHAVQLHAAVARWNTLTTVSKKAVVDLEREALALPEGSLVIAGRAREQLGMVAPVRRAAAVHAHRPHQTRAHRLHDEAALLPRPVERPHAPDARDLVQLPQPSRCSSRCTGTPPPAASRSSPIAKNPFLRAMIPVLLETPTADTLDSRLQELLDKLVAGRFVR